MNPKIVDRDQKRQEIVMAALRVFNLKGIHGSRMQDIATQAGIGKGTIYEYFDSKEEILVRFVDTLLAEYDELLTALRGDVKDPVTTLLTIIKESCQKVHEQADIAGVLFELLHSRDLDEKIGLIARFSDWFDSMATLISDMLIREQQAGKINPGVNCPPFARMIIASLDGLMLHALIFTQDQKWIDEQIREFQNMVALTLRADGSG